jgi:hypothetical protein
MTLLLRPNPIPERIVYVRVPPPSEAVPAPKPEDAAATSSPQPLFSFTDSDNLWASSAEYLQQRNQAIRWGVDALPPAPSTASSVQALTIESMLGLPERKAEHMGLFPWKF